MGWYYVITQEMIEWGLTGNELLVYALINGFSQKGQGCYWGSLDTMAQVCGFSKKTAMRTLQSLTEKGFIKKNRAVVNNEFRIIYIVTRVSNCPLGGQNVPGDRDKMSPNNKVDNKYRERESKGTHRFIKPSISEIASYCTERNNGIDANEFFDFYESKGWVVGKSPMKDWKAAVRTWESSRKKSTKSTRTSTQPHKESAFEHNLKVADEMFGTNNWEKVYGK